MYLIPIYREANTYNHLFDQWLSGNPDNVNAKTLQQKAWQLMAPHFEQERQAALDRYQELAGTDKASRDLDDILLAAKSGRVEVLFSAVGQQQWGEFDMATTSVTRHETPRADSRELLSLAASDTITNGGTVYALPLDEMPDKAQLAAIFRYTI